MYLSLLQVNVDNRPGRLWLRNRYRVHQRLCMAFPSAERRARDAEFLKPYTPEDFGKGHVHVPRSTRLGFLFRVDPQQGGNTVILVQSAIEPDWGYAFQNARHMLAAEPQVREFAPEFAGGQSLRFRLEANPVRRGRAGGKGTDQKPLGKRWVGKRIPVGPTPEALAHWLERRAEPLWGENSGSAHDSPPGFMLDDGWLFSVVRGYAFIRKGGSQARGRRMISARYEGRLTVMDAQAFAETLRTGIGPGKAFGFGLLSAARM